MSNYGYEFGGAGGPGVAGPLIGGGVAKVGELGARLLFKSKPAVVKWAPAIGLALGAGLGTVLAVRRKTRATGISALITAAIVTVPTLVERAMGGTLSGGYLGVVTAEDAMMGADGIDLMSGSGSMGVVTAEEGMNGADGVDLLGQGGGFGTNMFSTE
jgi:hypothetical protein